MVWYIVFANALSILAVLCMCVAEVRSSSTNFPFSHLRLLVSPHQLVRPDPPHQLVGPVPPHQLVGPVPPHQLVGPDSPHQLVGPDSPHWSTGEAISTTPTGRASSTTPTGGAISTTPTDEAISTTPTGRASSTTPTGGARFTTPTGGIRFTTPTIVVRFTTPVAPQQTMGLGLPHQPVKFPKTEKRKIRGRTTHSACPSCSALSTKINTHIAEVFSLHTGTPGALPFPKHDRSEGKSQLPLLSAPLTKSRFRPFRSRALCTTTGSERSIESPLFSVETEVSDQCSAMGPSPH